MNNEAFCIMQIGNPEMDSIYEEVLKPAAAACGLTAKRVDKHNSGNLLKSEIVRYLNDCVILIADITNERPNCYLEIGYAMGLGKTSNLILASKEDHLPGHPDHRQAGPKIHFDLSGYDIILWNKNNLELYQKSLIEKIKQRLKLVRTLSSHSSAETDLWLDPWVKKHQAIASSGLNNAGRDGAMEFAFRFQSVSPISGSQLVRTLESSTQHWFGWPIGIVLHNQASAPKPDADGVWSSIQHSSGSYDYWALTKTLKFYTLVSFFEDERSLKPAFFTDVRIGRVAESLLLIPALARALGLPLTDPVEVAFRHTGLDKRILGSGAPAFWAFERKCAIAEMASKQVLTPFEIENGLPDVVRSFLHPIFETFDFYEPPTESYNQYTSNALDEFRLKWAARK